MIKIVDEDDSCSSDGSESTHPVSFINLMGIDYSIKRAAAKSDN